MILLDCPKVSTIRNDLFHNNNECHKNESWILHSSIHKWSTKTYFNFNIYEANERTNELAILFNFNTLSLCIKNISFQNEKRKHKYNKHSVPHRERMPHFCSLSQMGLPLNYIFYFSFLYYVLRFKSACIRKLHLQKFIDNFYYFLHSISRLFFKLF